MAGDVKIQIFMSKTLYFKEYGVFSFRGKGGVLAMPVFRVEKNKNFTIMSNHHLRNKDMSLKAKGLLSIMLSLPEEWDFSLWGLVTLSKDRISAVRAAINELERLGYLTRIRRRNDKGQLKDSEYIIYEQPISEKPMLENLTLENPTLEKPTLENQTQLNTNISNTNKINKDILNTQSINHSKKERMGELYDKTIAQVKAQIEYDSLILNNDKGLIDDIVVTMADVLTIDRPYYVIRGDKVDTDIVRKHYEHINYQNLAIFLLDFNGIDYPIKDKIPYLTSALFNVPRSANTSITNRVICDMKGGSGRNDYRYVTKDTFDSYSYQLVENKQKFISQIMTSKSPIRRADDIDETALSYAEIKALATGNPHIKEKMELDMEVSKLKLLKSSFMSEKYDLEDKVLKIYPQQIAEFTEQIQGMEKDIETVAKYPKKEEGIHTMTIDGLGYFERKTAADALLERCKRITSDAPAVIGDYRGFTMILSTDSFEVKLTMQGARSYTIELGTDALGNIQRIDNALAKIPEFKQQSEESLEVVKKQLVIAEEASKAEFPQEAELNEKIKRLAALDALLNMDKRDNSAIDMDTSDVEVPQRKDAMVR